MHTELDIVTVFLSVCPSNADIVSELKQTHIFDILVGASFQFFEPIAVTKLQWNPAGR